MSYRATKTGRWVRCAVDLEALDLPISREEALAILCRKEFSLIEVDMIALARQWIGRSAYRRGTWASGAPAVVDCSSFVKWLYAQRGIWLPRLAVQQRECGERVHIEDIVAGDLVFVSGRFDFYRSDPSDGVGHVGIATGDGTVVHASYEAGVVEVLLGAGECRLDLNKLRDVRRYIPNGAEVLTLEVPTHILEVESADDIRWFILQSLPKERWRG